VIIHHGVLDSELVFVHLALERFQRARPTFDVALLQKPFTPDLLARKVCQTLDAEPRGHGNR
jgi:hypothetical protein